jgi:hypothetical protein
MRVIFKAAAAFFLAALFHGSLPPLNPHWRAVAAELHQARPQAGLQAELHALFQHGKDR